MATKSEINAVYAAWLIPGVALVTFPAASTIFTDPSPYDMSNTQYGMMFLPQVITAVTGALLGGRLTAQRASSAYLTVSETWPIEIRAEAIAVFFAIGSIAGALGRRSTVR